MYSRYRNTKQAINISPLYKETFLNKKTTSLQHYSLFQFNQADLSNSIKITHPVEPNEKLYMISQKYYETPELGWVILYTNGLSSELQLQTGMILNIYLDLRKILGV